MRRIALIAPAVLAAVAVASAPAGAQTIDQDLIKWPQRLPPLPTTTEVQPGPVRNCRGRATIRGGFPGTRETRDEFCRSRR